MYIREATLFVWSSAALPEVARQEDGGRVQESWVEDTWSIKSEKYWDVIVKIIMQITAPKVDPRLHLCGHATLSIHSLQPVVWYWSGRELVHPGR